MENIALVARKECSKAGGWGRGTVALQSKWPLQIDGASYPGSICWAELNEKMGIKRS